MNITNNQQQLKKCSNVNEIPKKASIVLGRDGKEIQPKQKTSSSEKSYDDTLKNVDELPEDDESIRNAVDSRK